MRRGLRRWRRGKGEERDYREMKIKYREICKRKKKEEEERIIREIGEANTERKVWDIVNRGRKNRRKVNEEIEEEDWREYFMELLGGVGEKVVRGTGKKKREVETELEREEVRKVIKKLKDRKAMGKDGIGNEVWKYGGEEIEKWAWETCNRVWKGEGWPEEWKDGVIIPIVKKGEGKELKEYRGITLMPTLYRIYTTIIGERLCQEVETKNILKENQTGFRKGKGVIDNIYAINYLAQRQMTKEKGKMIALFIDLKAAFDSVDRGVLMKAIRERGISEELIERIEDIIRETRNGVKIGGEVGENFWTARGVRQGCPLSPMLFNILLADLEEEMSKGGWGGVRLRNRKIYSLTYADDIVMLAEGEDEMRALISRLERYLGEKRLILNTEKTKIMVFRKGRGRKRKINWRWEGKKIEEVRKIRYLGYMLQTNGKQEEHIKERVRRATGLMGGVWGIGKRKFGKDIKRRLWLFDTLIWTVLGYGAEIWGWEEKKEIERVEERYLRWVLGVDWRTPGYLMREELQRDKLRGRTARRAWNFERKLEEGRGGGIARECIEEMKEKAERKRKISEWEGERKDFFEEKEIWKEGIAWKREGEMLDYKVIEEKERERQRKERWERIKEARYNKWYRKIKGEGIPEYLKKGWTENRWNRIARFRMGNEMREGWYWEREEKRKCRVCEGEEESWEHVLERCRRDEKGEGKVWQERVIEILEEGGGGEKWLIELETWREDMSSRGGSGGGGGVNEGVRENE